MGYSHQKGFSWLHILFALVLAVILFLIFVPLNSSRSHLGARTEALNNAKAIAGGLTAFKAEYGAYPSPETRKLLEEKGYYRFTDRDDANAYLAQLIVTDIIDDETVFYASKAGAIKGDNNITKAEDILSKGENAFAYLMTLNQKPLTDVSTHTPLVIAPLKFIGTIPTFDPEPFQGKYVYGAVDGSGKVGEIGDDGRALSEGRTHLFQTGPDSLFGDKIPVIKLPFGQ